MWYFKDNKWPQAWQDEAIEITRRVFDTDYKDVLAGDVSRSSVGAVQTQESNKVSKSYESIYHLLLTLCIDKYFPLGNAHSAYSVCNVFNHWSAR